MGQQIEKLAQFVASTRWEDIPEKVKRQAKLVLMDTVGVILAGSVRPEVKQLREKLGATAGSGASIYAHGCPAHDPRTAALLNGIAGRAIELCEGLRLVSGQAGVQSLPAILATAEHLNLKGSEVLAALALGYDVAGRLGLGFTPRPLAHQNGQIAMLAASAACARVRGMSAREVSLAMRIPTTLMLTPSYTNAVAGATALNVAGGMSNYVGTLAPELALAGFEAQPDAIEETLGQLVGNGFKPDNVLDDLGARWHITENYFRMYACCNPVHPALDAVKAVTEKLKPRPEEIERIDVATYRFASVMNNTTPPNFFASKYSLPHAAAVLVVKGKAGHTEVNDEAVRDPVISALRQRVHMSEDPAMTARAPRLRPARVTMTLNDGRTATESRDSHRGDFSEPYTDAELRGKFHELAGFVLTKDGVARVEEALERFEHTNVRDFVEALKCST